MTEWNAGDYARQSSLQESMAKEQLGHLKLEGSEHILDVGCGDGKITAEIARRVPGGSVVGVDPSKDMVGFASKHFAPSAFPNLRFAVGDAGNLTYKQEFDLVVSFNALHWVSDQDAALRSIHTALKPTGRALLRFVPDGPRKCLEDVIEDVRQSARWSAHFQNYRRPYLHSSPEAFRALAEKNGFRVVNILVEDKAWDFKSREGFTAFCRATFFEWTRRLPEAEWGEFIENVLDQYRIAAADGSEDANTFKFYQMTVMLAVENSQH